MATLPVGVTVEKVRESLLWGLNFVDQAGNELPDVVLEGYLLAAVELIEEDLGIAFSPKSVVSERHDLQRGDAMTFYQGQLDVRPVRSFNHLKLRWGNLPQPFTIPPTWLHLRNANRGEYEVIVDNSSIEFTAQTGWPFMFGPGSNAFNRSPSWLDWSYEAGIEDGELSELTIQVIGIAACSIPLGMLGDLPFGSPGVRSRSQSIDGLSQSASAPDGLRQRVEAYRSVFSAGMGVLRTKYGTNLRMWAE